MENNTNITEQQDTVTIPKAEYEKLKEELESTRRLLAQIVEANRLSKRKQYGSSSEKRVIEINLFNEAENEATVDVKEEVSTTTVEKHTRKKKRNMIDKDNLPKNLPMETVVHELPEEERLCEQCGSVMEKCGEYEKYELKIVPAKFSVVRHVYNTYNCVECKKDAAKDVLVRTPLEPQVIDGSYASAEAITYLVVQKYMMHTPLYRMEQELKTQGIRLSRQTMSNWILISQEKWLKPIYERLHENLLTKQILHADETTLQVLKENGKSAKSKSYMWLYRTGEAEDEQIVLYEYKPDRKKCNPEAFLKGFKGYLHVDGYAAYNNIDSTARNVGCLVHARRKFIEAQEAMPKDEQSAKSINEGLGIFRQIFDLEKEYAKLPNEERHIKRKENTAKLIDKLKVWSECQAERILPQSQYGKALTYLKNQWAYLVRFLEDGRLQASNNLAERSIKPFVMGRKNWLFNDNPRGAEASAVIFSIVQTAKANGLDPYAYLLYIFRQAPLIAKDGVDWVEVLLPKNAPKFCEMPFFNDITEN